MLSEYRFTRAWENLTPESYPTSSPESKAAFLAALKWENEDGSWGFNPLALLSMVRSWAPGMLSAETRSWHDLVEEVEGKVVATQKAMTLTDTFVKIIMADDRFVWLGDVPAGWTNSGSVDDGVLVVNDGAGITGSRLGWFVRTEAQMEKAITEGLDPVSDPEVLALEPDTAGGQLTRCANPAWPTPPPGIPTGPTDEPKHPEEDIWANPDLSATVADSGGGHAVSTSPGTGATSPTVHPTTPVIPDSQIWVGQTTVWSSVSQGGTGGYWTYESGTTYDVYKDKHREWAGDAGTRNWVWHADPPPQTGDASGGTYAGDPGE
jgi:hypothetical protein